MLPILLRESKANDSHPGVGYLQIQLLKAAVHCLGDRQRHGLRVGLRSSLRVGMRARHVQQTKDLLCKSV